jgi:altronate dehydratase
MTAEDLVVAVDCAGSDATSGLASNPAVGAAADMLIQAGGTVYFFNILEELVGLAHVLPSRAASRKVAEELRELAAEEIERPESVPSLGNVRGGLTTAREKAAGALAKAGGSSIRGVVRSFERPKEPGLYLEVPVPGSYEGLSDPQCAIQMAACGAHIVVETTGVGTVTGGVVSPVIKVCANPKTCALLADDIDVDASGIMIGDRDIQEVGEEIYREVLAVAVGKRTRSEVLGHLED